MHEDFALAAFEATFDAIDFKQRLERAGIVCAVMPLPQSIESSCGLAVRFGLEQLTRAEEVRAQARADGMAVALYRARIVSGRPVFSAMA